MSLESRTHGLVLLSVLIFGPTTLAVLGMNLLYVLMSLHLGEQPHLAASLALVIATGALTAYWVLLLDLCSAGRTALRARGPAWTTALISGQGLALLLLAWGLWLGRDAWWTPTDAPATDARTLAAWVAFTLVLIALPAWLLQLRAEHARSCS
jgi:hypothetical protein